MARMITTFALCSLLLTAWSGCPRDTQYLVITIDVEALPQRTSEQHVQRLIYGNFGPGRKAGIEEMMDTADRHGVELSFFVDVIEEFLYPGEIQEVAELISARGHDVELHTHPLLAPESFWDELGFERKLANDFTKDEALAMLSSVDALTANWQVPPPVAYRSGGYRSSPGILQALPEFDIYYSYNYNLKRSSKVGTSDEHLPVFSWENGVTEVPISYVPRDDTLSRFDDRVLLDSDPRMTYTEMDRFAQTFESDNVLVMMMHSWSLLYMENLETGGVHFVYKDDRRLAAFDRFLAELPDHVEVVSARKLAALVDERTVLVTEHRTMSDIFDPETP